MWDYVSTVKLTNQWSMKFCTAQSTLKSEKG